jgi:hypothetical protein
LIQIATLKRYAAALKSKTLVFFGVIGTYLLNNAESTIGQLQSAMPQLAEYLPSNPYKTLGALLVVGGIVLRTVTTKPLVKPKGDTE